jgi:ElaB/YqjD/DUF883 family membrane-anchored ribosome-binding protein
VQTASQYFEEQFMPAENNFESAINAATVNEKVSQVASQVKAAATDFGHTAANKIDENRGSAASGLEDAASALREKAGSLPGGEKIAAFANGAADSLSSTAEYVKKRNVQGMRADFGKFVKNNPGRSLLAAVALGFVIGHVCKSIDAA